jgi:hypothetical protein
MGAPVFCDSFLSLACSLSGSQTVVRFFIKYRFLHMSRYVKTDVSSGTQTDSSIMMYYLQIWDFLSKRVS